MSLPNPDCPKILSILVQTGSPRQIFLRKYRNLIYEPLNSDFNKDKRDTLKIIITSNFLKNALQENRVVFYFFGITNRRKSWKKKKTFLFS